MPEENRGPWSKKFENRWVRVWLLFDYCDHRLLPDLICLSVCLSVTGSPLLCVTESTVRRS